MSPNLRLQQRLQVVLDGRHLFVPVTNAEAATEVDMVQWNINGGKLAYEEQEFVKCFGKRRGVEQL